MLDLMNLALKFKDYEWAKELYEQNESIKNESIINGNEVTGEKVKSAYEEKIALEDISTQYAVIEKDGIRSFNINSEFDRNYSELAILESPPYKKGEKINYFVPSSTDLIFIRGTFNGYLMGYEEAYGNLNKQIAIYFKSLENKGQTAVSSLKKQAKPRKGKNDQN